MNALVMPTETFAELAFELRVYAQREVATNQSVEVFLASQPAGLTPAHRRLVTDLQQSAALVGRAAMLLALLAPHEAAVRALVADKTGDITTVRSDANQVGERHACLAGR